MMIKMWMQIKYKAQINKKRKINPNKKFNGYKTLIDDISIKYIQTHKYTQL